MFGNDGNFYFIDLDFVGLYPALYDLFSYLFTYIYIKDSDTLLSSDYLHTLVFNTLNKIVPGKYNKSNIIDIYLAAFITSLNNSTFFKKEDKASQHIAEHCKHVISCMYYFNFNSFPLAKKEYFRSKHY